MRRFLLATFLTILYPSHIFASVYIESLLPNPAGDDTLGEYIEIYNTGCESVDISGYQLSDLSGKRYILSSGTTIASHANMSFPYSQTKIALNNTGNEAVYLKDAGGATIDTYQYSGTQKDNIILSVTLTDDTCDTLIDTSSGNVFTETGTTDISPGTLDTSTGEVMVGTGAGDSGSGVIGTGITEVIIAPSGDTGNGVSNSGSTQIDTGASLSFISSNTHTGATDVTLTDSSTLGVLIETGALVPIEMYYSDSDSDGMIDTLEILYPYMLTGIVHTGSISLYSNTGGLMSTRIDTATGHILDGTLSGNILILSLLEGDIEKNILKINNTTSSDLRLKSSGNLGFTSIGWQIPEDFFLTKSFDSYRNVRPKSPGITENTTNSSGASIVPIVEIASFPTIIPTLQSPTNASFSGEAFFCTNTDCRINITLESLFMSGYSQRDYMCAFGTGASLVRDTDCNPNTLYYTSRGVLAIELSLKSNPLISIRKEYPVSVTSPSLLLTSNLSVTLDTTKPVAILEIDGKWKEYYEQIDTYEMNCYTWTCSLNFTAEKSYDPGGGSVRFFWIYGANKVGWSKDPGTQKYPLGNHEMILRVIDASGNYDEIRYLVHVLGPKPKEEKAKSIKKIKSTTDTVKVFSETMKKKKPKKMRMIFFSPPSLDIQGDTTEMSSSGNLKCLYKKKKLCKLNLALTDTLKGYTYIWSIDGEEVFRGKNPKAWSLEPGSYTLSVATYSSGSSLKLDEQIYRVDVKSTPKKQKKSAHKPKTIATSKVEIIPNVHAEGIGSIDETTRQSAGSAMILFLSGIFMGYVIRRKSAIYYCEK